METVAANSTFVRSAEIVGVNVINQQNDLLGSIYDIVLHKLSGQVAYVVIESGAFLGLGGKLLAFPWEIFKFDEEEGAFRINLKKDQITNAPGFDKNDWPKSNENTIWNQISAYYHS